MELSEANRMLIAGILLGGIFGVITGALIMQDSQTPTIDYIKNCFKHPGFYITCEPKSYFTGVINMTEVCQNLDLKPLQSQSG